MAAQYTLWLCNDRGRRLMPLNNLRAFAGAKALNQTVGFSAIIKTPSDLSTLQDYHFVERNIKRDWQVQLWRKLRGPARLWQSYLVLKWGWAQGDDGSEIFKIGGYDMSHLLTRRIVAAYAEEAQAVMTDYADDMMKAIVTDSLQDDADPVPESGTRAWGDLTIAADVSKAPSIEMAFAWDRLLTPSGRGVLPRIAEASRAGGTELFFAIRPASLTGNGATWQFFTWTDAIHDLTTGANRVIFDADRGELEAWELNHDYSEEANYIYAGGQGEADARYIEQAYDASRYNASYWGRCEDFLDIHNVTDDEVDAEAAAYLNKSRPRIEIIGRPVSRPGQAFGRHYDVGAKVLAKAKGRTFTAMVQSAIVELDEDGAAKETVRLEYRNG